MRKGSAFLFIAAFVAAASPGVETPISTRIPGPASAGVHQVALVPQGDGFLGLWTAGSGCPSIELRGIRLDSQLHPRDASSFPIATSAYTATIVGTAADGDAAYVAWRANDSALLRVDADGTATTLTHSLPANTLCTTAPLLSRTVTVSLMPTTSHDINPRLVQNGTDYLLLWERWYDPFFFITTPPPCWTPPKLPNELFAQRYDAALIPAGAPIALATTTNYNDYLLDVQGADASVAGGIWLVTWIDRWAAIRYARIDQNGIRLEPLDGQLLMPSPSIPFLSASERGWLIASQDPMGVQFARVGIDGTFSAPVEIPGPGIFSLEAIIATPSPLVAYTRPGSTAAYVDILPPRRRSVAH